MLVACGGTTNAPVASPAPRTSAKTPAPSVDHVERAPIDPISAFAQPRTDAAWIEPGPAQLVLGGPSLQADDEVPVAVDLLEERGSEIRVGVRLDHVRFALWTSRARMLAVLVHDAIVSEFPGGGFVGRDAPSVSLAAGAHVQRLSHEGESTKIRYLGSLEVEGWVPDSVLGDVGPADHVTGSRSAPVHKPLMVIPGATIRTEKRWASRALAVARYSMWLGLDEDLGEGWTLVSYRDGDVTTTGFLNKREPPSRTHRPPDAAPSTPMTTNATVPAETCLYAGDEPIGLVIGDQPALVEPTQRVGWYTVTLDTPWGAIAFDAKGPTETALSTCPSP